jgi:hypothetical protein
LLQHISTYFKEIVVGDIADYYIDNMLAQQMEDSLFGNDELEEFLLPLYKNGIWVTKYGTALPIREMETSHIKNCINKIMRGEMHELCMHALPHLKAEFKKRMTLNKYKYRNK